jgi:hypothetical protein
MTIIMVSFLSAPARAQLVGTDTTPGTACTAKGAVRITANATGPGAYILTCDDDAGQWVATINAELPTANEQVANKEYVDSAVAAGGIGACVDDDTTLCALETSRSSNDPEFIAANIANGVNILGVTGTFTGGLSGPSGCANIGDLCADGTVFAGYHPITQEHLFIPTTDQGTTSAWKTSIGTNDIATDSTWDGRANTDQIANSTTFPAFKLCKDLTTGGHSDWYLPSQVEAYYLWAVRPTIQAAGNITDFQNDFYWSSTEYDTIGAWLHLFIAGLQLNSDKTLAYRVRCVRR